MARYTLTHTHTREGFWNGVLKPLEGAPPVPQLGVFLREREIATPALEDQGDGTSALSFAISAEFLNDGVQTFLVVDKPTGDTLAHYTVVTGQALEDDFRAELDLLRAEVDMLKKAFRRHCLETL